MFLFIGWYKGLISPLLEIGYMDSALFLFTLLEYWAIWAETIMLIWLRLAFDDTLRSYGIELDDDKRSISV